MHLKNINHLISRSRCLRVLLIGLLLAQCLACQREEIAQAQPPLQPGVAQRVAGEDWPTFLGPRGDGTSAEQGIDLARWSPIPPVVWTMPLGISYGAPTIDNGRLFMFERIGEVEQLTCYEAETARQLWKWGTKVQYDDMFGYNNGPRCSPIIDGNLVYLYGVTGKLSCLDINSGQLKWTRDLNKEYAVVPNFFGVASNPCIYENLLLVMVGGSTPETSHLPTERLAQVKPNGTAVVAFDKLTGQEVYRVGNDLASYASLVVKDIAGKPMGLAFLRNSLMAWDPATGNELFDFPWRAPMLESVNAALPIVVGNQVLISEAYEVGSALLDIEQGKPNVVWKDGGPRSSCRFRAHWSTPVVIDGYLYGCSGRNGPDTDFRCVRLSDGEVMWTDRNHDRQRSSLLLVDQHLIVLGEYGLLELMRPNPEKLEILASTDLASISDQRTGEGMLQYPCWAAPVLSHGLLYVRGNQSLVCLDLIPSAGAP